MTHNPRDRRSERGAVMVFAALAMATLLLFAAYAIDVGAVWSSRTQSQNADDSAALAAAQKMIVGADTNSPSVDIPGATATGIAYAAANSTVGEASVTVTSGDFTFGNWDLATRTFQPLSGSDLSNPNKVRAVKVNVRMDDVDNNRSPAFFSRLIGRSGFEVHNTAIAYLGFAGSNPPGDFDLPVAIDSCDIVSEPCGSDFCQVIASPPNPCPLETAQDVDGDNIADPAAQFTCLEFSSTGEQNACWTVFDGDNPSVNNPELQDTADDGNAGDVMSGDEVYLDNGDKTATLDYIRDMFYGGEKQQDPYYNDPQGSDRYFPFPAPSRSDSWVVKLPVVECQDTAHCAGGETYAINGGVCFEIREILGPPTRKIKGRFLCPTDTDPQVQNLYNQYCRGSDDAPGGCNYGDSANRVVLVQ